MVRRGDPGAAPQAPLSQRERQKQRTRAALVDAARMLIRSGEGVTMPGIARQAGVSDATAYRHFADLLAVLREGFVGVWPDVSEALPDLIALTITHPDENVGTRPAYRLELIDKALEGAIGLSPVVTTDAPSA